MANSLVQSGPLELKRPNAAFRQRAVAFSHQLAVVVLAQNHKLLVAVSSLGIT